MTFRDVRSALAASAAACVWVVGTPAEAQTRAFNLPAQSAATGIPEFARQADVQILVSESATRGRTTRAVNGRMPVREALDRLLAGTSLRVSASDGRTFTLSEAPARPGEGQAGGAPAESESAEEREIVVTGSRLNRRGSQSALPVQSFSAEDIARSGRGTVTEFLQNQPAVSVNSLENSRQLQLNNTQPTIRLRGLPIGTTLTLIDGRRVTSSGAAIFGLYFDLNTIPAAAIDRVDLLLAGASPIYGSDAIAGVLNINLKRDITGLHVDTRYGFADGTSEYQASAATGLAFPGGSVSVIGSYFRRTPLEGVERGLTRDADYTRFGGSDLRIESCNPGNIYSATGQDLPGLGSAFAAIPGAITGTPQVSDFAATQGTVNRCSDTAEYDIAPATERLSGLVLGQFDLSARTVLRADLMISHVEQQKADRLPRVTRLLVPAANPFNPFGADILISRAFPGTSRDYQTLFSMNSTFVRGALALRSHLSDDWVADASIVYSRQVDNVDFPNSQLNSAALQNALADTDPATAFNPFISDLSRQRELIDGFLDDYTQKFTSSSFTAQAYLSGNLFQLPAGDVAVAFGGEHIVDSVFRGGTYLGADKRLSRNVDALFAEARAPIVSAEDSRGQFDRLAVTLSGRADWYSDVGRTINPQAGIEFRPVRDLLVRANYAEGFRAATLVQQGGPTTQFAGTVTDPLRNERYVIAAQTGGNPDLEPETSSSFEVGAVYDARGIHRPHLELSYWAINYRNPIQRLFSQALVNNEALFPDLVTRADPTPADVARGVPGLITSVRDVYVNFGRIDVSGIDASASARFPFAGGQVEPSVALTRITQFRVALTPSAAAQNRLSLATVDGVFAPKLKATFGVIWSGDQRLFSAGIVARYVGRYTDYDGVSPLGNLLYFDLNVRVDPAAVIPAIPANRFQLSLGAVNLFDRGAQFSRYPYGGGYDPNQADLRGRFVYLGFGLKL